MISLLSAIELLGVLQMMFTFRMHPFNNGSHTAKSSESGLQRRGHGNVCVTSHWATQRRYAAYTTSSRWPAIFVPTCI